MFGLSRIPVPALDFELKHVPVLIAKCIEEKDHLVSTTGGLEQDSARS
jgi:hypothetical protein